MSGYVSGLIILVGINIIAVLGVSILTGFTRLFSFGNAGFMAIGAYVSAVLTVKYDVPFIAAILIAALAAGIIGLALGKLTLKLKGDYFLITTLGFGECVRVIIEFLDPITGGARGYSGIRPLTTLPVVIVSVVLAFWIAWNFLHSKYGRNLKAIREQEMAAEAVGINVARFKELSFSISAVFAGWAGALFAHYIMFITPNMFNLDKSSEFTITVVIGGLGSLSGSILATAALTLLPEVLRSMAEYRMLMYGIIVVIIVILRPSGIMGYKEFSLKWVLNLFRKKSKDDTVEKGVA
jgi:branched-chain amino acid transport system permease protein